MRHHAAIRDRPVKHRTAKAGTHRAETPSECRRRRQRHRPPPSRRWRMSPAPCRRSASIADAAMAGVHSAGRQRFGQELDQVGAMHAEGRVPARGIRHLHRRDRRAVVAEIMGVRADARTPLLNRRPEPEACKCRTLFGVRTRRRRPRRVRAPVRRCQRGGRCAISALAANKPPIPPPTNSHFERRIRHYDTPVDRRSCLGTVVSASSL